MQKSLIVVDCQYDFISGTLACINAEQAVANIIEYINANPNIEVFYSADWHSPNNQSFQVNGGIWPVHCVAGQKGAQIHEAFYTKIQNPLQRPNAQTVFYKGKDDVEEEYSAFAAQNSQGCVLNDMVGQVVEVCGIASEFCCKETALAFYEHGNRVCFLSDCMAYVSEEGHIQTKESLRECMQVV